MTAPEGRPVSRIRVALRRLRVRPQRWHLVVVGALLVGFYFAVERQVESDRIALTYSAADAAVELVRQRLFARGDVTMVKGELRAGAGRVADDTALAETVRSESHFDCTVFQGRTPVTTTLRTIVDGHKLKRSARRAKTSSRRCS